MNKVLLGSTGLSVNRLVFGTLPLGPLQANLSATAGGALIRHALESGVTLLDTAELYGTYPHIREALRGFSGEVRIASKTHATTAAEARGHVVKALQELAIERLDIVHIHGARLADPCRERAAVLEELLLMKQEGKIGHLGISSHYIAAFREAARHPEIEVVHPLINRIGMGIMDGSAAEMAEAIACCSESGKGVYAMKALAGGNLISEARASIRYVLGLPGVDALALGMLSREEIDANLKLCSLDEAHDEAWGILEKRRRTFKIMEKFCNGCGDCIDACIAQALVLEAGVARVKEEECILCGYCAAACPDFLIRVV
ncbi:MAG: 4Fe-4S dicluster domain-containing protein [Deltaproteobacteria bacterium]|nr:4Fe-4S dicluster domain-containing protein [Deltaproteobacteria bacterium]TLN04678.1 MAG: 4Fe-4S dicluster domain-containing protein [bacterium]